MITISQAQLLRGTKLLLDETSLIIYPKHKIGLVGANGTGKSSLFSLLLKTITLDKGEVSLPKDWSISTVKQDTPALDCAAIDYVIDGDTNYRQVEQDLKKAESIGDGNLIANLHHKLDAIGGYTIRSRAAVLLSGLGFNQSEQLASVKSFSGGWRMRLNLAQALLCQSDLLLLDEPTNHLDLDTMYWLEGWLKNYQGTLILISHDRDFIDSVVTEIVHIENQKLNLYSGNYSSFEHIRAERLAQQVAAFEKQQRQKAHMQSFVDRFRYKASKAKQAQSRLKAIEKLDISIIAQANNSFEMEFKKPQDLPNPLIAIDQVSVGYADKTVLTKIQLNLVPGARIGLLGRNGAGKSTLIKLLAGSLAPSTGDFKLNPGLNIGYFAQHQIENLEPNSTPMEHLLRLNTNATEQEMRNFLGGFGFGSDLAFSQVAPFSGGEKARLVLALIVWQRPNLLLLDEPTNHLDLEMRHTLTLALQEFVGAMILVSHDRYLLRATCDEYYLVDQGSVTPFSGDLDDYASFLIAYQEPTNKKINNDNKNDKRIQAEKRQKLSPLKKQQDLLEKQQTKINTKLKLIENELSDPNIYNDDQKANLKQILDKQIKLHKELSLSENEWFLLQDKIELLT